MATLSKHGNEIGRIEYLLKTKAYCADGTILQNMGDGWRLYGKVKPEIDPKQNYQNRKASHDKFLDAHPAFAAYYDELHSLTCQSKRYYLHAAIEMMPDDPDGVWSTFADALDPREHIDLDLDDCVKIGRLYKNMETEMKVTRNMGEALNA